MKREELEKLGLTKEQIDSVLDLHHAEIDPVKGDLQKSQDDLKLEQDKVSANDKTIKDLKNDLAKFKDVDVSELQKKIEDLEGDIKQKDADHAKELADRDFAGILKDSISAANGKDADKIIKLLDVEVLKESKNQKDDIAAAIKAMAEDDVTKGMFGETAPQVSKTGNIIGEVTGSGVDAADAQMRAVMGLPPIQATDKTN